MERERAKAVINERVLEAIVGVDPELGRGWNFVTFSCFLVCKFIGVSGERLVALNFRFNSEGG
jgi:hypothetical protein